MIVPSEILKSLRTTQTAGLWNDKPKKCPATGQNTHLARTLVSFLHLTAEGLPCIPALLPIHILVPKEQCDIRDITFSFRKGRTKSFISALHCFIEVTPSSSNFREKMYLLENS